MTDGQLEELAALEHRQWMSWVSWLIENEDIPEDLESKWEENLIPYSELPEEEKEKDRKWVRKVLEVIDDD